MVVFRDSRLLKVNFKMKSIILFFSSLLSSVQAFCVSKWCVNVSRQRTWLEWAVDGAASVWAWMPHPCMDVQKTCNCLLLIIIAFLVWVIFKRRPATQKIDPILTPQVQIYRYIITPIPKIQIKISIELRI